MQTQSYTVNFLCAQQGPARFIHVSSEVLGRKGFLSAVLKAGGAVSMISRAAGLTFRHGGFYFQMEAAQ